MITRMSIYIVRIKEYDCIIMMIIVPSLSLAS